MGKASNRMARIVEIAVVRNIGRRSQLSREGRAMATLRGDRY
jgi:hypothetical protein